MMVLLLTYLIIAPDLDGQVEVNKGLFERLLVRNGMRVQCTRLSALYHFARLHTVRLFAIFRVALHELRRRRRTEVGIIVTDATKRLRRRLLEVEERSVLAVVLLLASRLLLLIVVARTHAFLSVSLYVWVIACRLLLAT